MTDDIRESDIDSNPPLPPRNEGEMNIVEHGKLLDRITNADKAKRAEHCYFCGRQGHHMATCTAYFVSLSFCEYCGRRGHPIWTCFSYLRDQNARQQRSVGRSNKRDDPRNKGYFYGRDDWGVQNKTQNQGRNICTISPDVHSPDSPPFKGVNFDIPGGQNDNRIPGYEGFLDDTETTVTDWMDRGRNTTEESHELTETMNINHQTHLDRFSGGDNTNDMEETKENPTNNCMGKNHGTILTIIGGIFILVANVMFLYFHQ